MDRHSVSHVIECTKYTFDTTILRRCVRTCEAQSNAVGREERVVDSIIELLPIVCLETKNGHVELCGYVGVEEN